jgi:hypothetical protein
LLVAGWLDLNPESTCVDASAAGLQPHSAPGWFLPAPLADRQRKCLPGLAGVALPLDRPGMLAMRAEIRRWAEAKAAKIHDFNQLAFRARRRRVLEREAAESADVTVDPHCPATLRAGHERQNRVAQRASFIRDIGRLCGRCHASWRTGFLRELLRQGPNCNCSCHQGQQFLANCSSHGLRYSFE